MFSSRFLTLLVHLGLLICCCSCIFSCSSLNGNYGHNPLIDDEFEDCGFEGPIPHIGKGSPISTMTFDFSSKEKAQQHAELWFNFLISPRAAGAHTGLFNRNDTREITLRGYNWFGLLPLVEHAFEKMHGLETVHWEIREPITETILRSIENNNPNCKIHYSFWTGRPGWTVVNSKLLYALKADIAYGYHENYGDMDFIFEVLSNASNLKELDICIHEDTCERGVGTPDAFPFLSHPSVRFPQLEVLKLNGYNLDERSDGGQSWSWRGKIDEWNELWRAWLDDDGGNDDEETEPPPRPSRPEDDGRTNLEAWLEAMDWSQLHTIHLAYPSHDTLNHLRGPTLPALRNLSITAGAGWGANQDEILSFVMTRTAQPLHCLSLQNIGAESGNKLLDNLSTSANLTQELRHFSFGAGGENVLFLDENKVSAFLAESSKIEHLDINLRRDVNRSMDAEGVFKGIVSCPTLKHLTLRFPSVSQDFESMDSGNAFGEQFGEMRGKENEGKDQGDEIDPLVNYEAALVLFKELRRWKKGVELEKLELCGGDWDNRNFYGIMGGPVSKVAYCWCGMSPGDADGREWCSQEMPDGFFK